MKKIEFVSYDGHYPNLCSGTLIVKIDGKEIKFNSCLSSNGSCYFTNDYQDEHVEEGDWEFRLDNKERQKLNLTVEDIEKIEELANENITHGCCGGCL